MKVTMRIIKTRVPHHFLIGRQGHLIWSVEIKREKNGSKNP